jgi:hypothetical protein
MTKKDLMGKLKLYLKLHPEYNFLDLPPRCHLCRLQIYGSCNNLITYMVTPAIRKNGEIIKPMEIKAIKELGDRGIWRCIEFLNDGTHEDN